MLTPPVMAAKTGNRKPKLWTLQALLKQTLQKNPKVHQARHELRKFKAIKQEAFAASWWPHGSVTAIFAPSPKMQGDAVNTSTPLPDAYFKFADYGFLTRFELTLAWPLYTFGKLSFYQEAANSGVGVGKANLKRVKKDMVLTIKRAYYGLQYAQSVLNLLEDSEEFLEDLKGKVKTSTEKIQLQYLEAEFKARKAQAQGGLRVAQVALARLAGVPPGKKFLLKDPELEMKSVKVRTLKAYKRLSRTHRPEFRLLQFAENAQLALLKAKQRSLLPDIFIGGFFRHGYSSVAVDQLSPFARDDFNFIEGGLFLGLRFTLDFPLKLTRIRKQQAHYQAFRSKRRFAHLGMGIELQKRFIELQTAEKIVRHRAKAKKSAEKWITRIVLSYSSGFSSFKDVMAAMQANGLAQFGYLEAVYKHKLAIANLERVTGRSASRLFGGKKSSKAAPPKKGVTTKSTP